MAKIFDKAPDMNRPEGRLKAARLAAGFPTATAFADRYNIPSPGYLAHERGRDAATGRGLSQGTAERYAECFRTSGLDITATWLRYGSGPAPDRVAQILSSVDGAAGRGGEWQDPSRAPSQDPGLGPGPGPKSGGDEGPVDRHLIAAVIAAVDEELERLGVTLAKEKRIDLYLAIHDLEILNSRAPDGARTAPVVDMARYRRFLRLAS